MQLTIASTQLFDEWALESPIDCVEGITETITIQVLGAGTITSPTAVAYKGTTVVTSTVFPSGSDSASGNIITLKPITGLVGNAIYVVTVTYTESGNTKKCKFQLRVQKVSQQQ